MGIFRLVCIATVMMSVTAVSISFAQRNFPIPRAEQEFRVLLSDAIPQAESLAGNVQRFIDLTMPYGPLDLTVTRSTDNQEIKILRNYFLGFIGAAAKIDARKLMSRFHCGPPCAAQRRNHLQDRLTTIKNLVQTIRDIPLLQIVAKWSQAEHRFNNYFFRNGNYSESLPSAMMGFVPSGHWREHVGVNAILNQVGITPEGRERLLEQMTSSDISAVVKHPNGSIRAIWAGISDNEAGLLFLAPGSPPPKIGQYLADGAKIVAFEEIEPGVYFYTTT